MINVSIVLSSAVDSRPNPQATPIAAVIQTPAAVVNPEVLTLPRWAHLT